MKIAITGSTGMVGEVLVSHLKSQHHEVLRIVRGATELHDPSPVVRWDIEDGIIEHEKLEGVDIIIHLAGASIAGKKWDDHYKAVIRDSRVKGTELLAKAITGLNNPPKVFISASAIGYYGNHAPDQRIDESSPVADDYLADVCRAWEEAARPVIDKGIRTVFMRTGVVFGPNGGALAKMLPIFKLGAGGKIGNGRQMMSWVSLFEFPSLIDFFINNDTIAGPVNCVSPNAVSNEEFTKTLGKVIKRPTFLPVPGFALRLLFGDMANALLINGAHVKPRVLNEAGYTFKYPNLEGALAEIL